MATQAPRPAKQGILLTKSGKTVTQLLFGGILLTCSLLLLVPSAVGIEEYNNRGTIEDNNQQKKMESYRNIQILILVIASIGVVFGIYFMATSEAVKGKGTTAAQNAQFQYNRAVDTFRPALAAPTVPTSGAYVPPMIVNNNNPNWDMLGGRRKLSSYRVRP